jgi:cytidylate kinase
MPTPDELISRHMKRWELDRRLGERFERDEAEAHVRHDIITISRERGSGGTLIGMMVAKALDWEFYDRELINSVAEQMGADPAHIAAYDERPPNFMQNVLLQLLEGKRPTSSQYLRSLIHIMRKIRTRGNAVIMGRAGQLILPDALRVRIIAPLDVRIERVAELEDLPLHDARREVLTGDRDRSEFIRAHFGVDPADSYYYDVTLNTAAMSLEHAAQLVICALRARQGVPG